jgi:hypothetical protein
MKIFKMSEPQWDQAKESQFTGELYTSILKLCLCPWNNMNIVWDTIGGSLGNSYYFLIWFMILFPRLNKKLYFNAPPFSQFHRLYYNFVTKTVGVWVEQNRRPRYEFNKCYWEKWLSAYRKLNLDPCLPPCTSINSKWIRTLISDLKPWSKYKKEQGIHWER